MTKLEEIANKERQKNQSKNDKSESDLYNAGHPDALSDGDDKGKGETNTVGSKTDIISRIQQISKNSFSDQNGYDAGGV